MRKGIQLSILALLLPMLALVGGCGSGKKEGTSTPVATATSPANLRASITGVDVSGPTPVVTFTLKDENGAALSPTTSGVSARFTIARIKSDGNYENYIPSTTATQPTYDSGGTFADLGNGTFSYTFVTDIKDPAQTLNGIVLDATTQSLTHTVAGQIQRTVTQNNGLTQGGASFQQATNPYVNFRPDGAAVTSTREVVSISSCNECHNKLGLHGGGRRDIALCIVCHYPGVIDPDSGNSVDMKSLIHKIHYGENLPSNVAGGEYQIVGFNGSIHSYKTVAYPFISGDNTISATPIECVKCHRKGTDLSRKPYGADVDKWKATSPTVSSASIENCTTCHDTTTFDAAATHTAGTATDAQCAFCHPAGVTGSNEFDITVVGSHTILEQSTVYTGVNFQIISATNTVAGQAPTVTFKITDNSGAVIVPSTGSFSIKIGYPATDYTNNLMVNFGQPLSQSLSEATANGDGSYSVTFATAIPAGKTGVGVLGIEGRKTYTITTGHKGTLNVNVGGKAIQYYFNLSTGQQIADPASQRRQSVDINKCNLCHSRLSLHGANRVNSIGECVICHNADATDRGRRPVGAPTGTPDNLAEQSVDFKVMIHKIHTGENLVLSQPYTIYGFGGTANDFSEVRYPQDRRNCLACHIDTTPKTYGLPLSTFVLGTSIATGTLLNDDSDNTRIPPMTAVCTSCHDLQLWVDHATTNTLGDVETCTQCHATGLALGPDFAHVPIR